MLDITKPPKGASLDTDVDETVNIQIVRVRSGILKFEIEFRSKNLDSNSRTKIIRAIECLNWPSCHKNMVA